MTEVNLTVCRVITLQGLFLLFSGKNCLLRSVSLCQYSTIHSVRYFPSVISAPRTIARGLKCGVQRIVLRIRFSKQKQAESLFSVIRPDFFGARRYSQLTEFDNPGMKYDRRLN